MFFVVATQRRFKISTRDGQPFAYLFVKKPATRIYKEAFATRGGGKPSRSWSKSTPRFGIAARSPAQRVMPSSRRMS